MNEKLIWQIAKGLLLARWKQTLVAAIGVAFSITMFISMQGFMIGLNKFLDGLILNRAPHVRLFKEIRPSGSQPVYSSPLYKGNYHFISSLKSANARLELNNSYLIMKALKADERVVGFSPRINAQVLFNYGTIDLNGAVTGIDVLQENRLFSFDDYITAGNAEDLRYVSNSIILGAGLADRLQVTRGDMVSITTAAGDRYRLKVAGFFQTGIQEVDKAQSYASIETTQKILARPASYITDIGIKIRDFRQAPAMAREYARTFNTDAEDIQAANAQFETGSDVRSVIAYAVGIALLIVAGFGIYNILNMIIYEKMDSIAILKATGFSGSDVKLIFLYMSLSIGLFGGLAGLVCGYLLSKGIDQIPFETAALPALRTYPVDYDPSFYLIGFLFSLVTTYLAGLFPARKAGKVDPVVIIRGK